IHTPTPTRGRYIYKSIHKTASAFKPRLCRKSPPVVFGAPSTRDCCGRGRSQPPSQAWRTFHVLEPVSPPPPAHRTPSDLPARLPIAGGTPAAQHGADAGVQRDYFAPEAV